MRADQTTPPSHPPPRSTRLYLRHEEGRAVVLGVRPRGRTGVSHRVPPRRARGGAAVERMSHADNVLSGGRARLPDRLD